MAKVSVLMPVYNAEDYLVEAIDSVINQSFEDWELIIGNDASTDRTEEIVLSYTDPRIKYFRNPENKGQAYTKYSMSEKISGKYVAFLDSDDVFYPDKLKIQVDFLDKNPDYGLCGTWGIMIDPQGNKMKDISFINHNEDIRCALLFSTTFIQSSIVVKKELFVEYFYDKEIPLVEDYNFWCRIADECKLENITHQLVKYRWHPTNTSNTKSERLKELVEKIYKRELAYIGIDATQFEISIHNAIRDKSSFDISDKEFFVALKNWMIKLAKANGECKKYDKDTFLATICFRWIFACKERKKYRKALNFPVRMNIKALCKLLRILYLRK